MYIYSSMVHLLCGGVLLMLRDCTVHYCPWSLTALLTASCVTKIGGFSTITGKAICT